LIILLNKFKNKKMIEKTKRENENLTKLKSQMKDMSAAFEVLKNTRIENKRQME